MQDLQQLIILASAKDRGFYEKAKARVFLQEMDFVPQEVWRGVESYYSRDEEATRCEAEILKADLAQRFPKKKELFAEYLSASVSVPNVASLFADYRRQQLLYKIQNEIVLEGKLLPDLMQQYLDSLYVEEQKTIYSKMSVEEIEAPFAENKLIRILPKKLNDKLGGGIPRQYHIGIIARPNTGKTAFCINMLYGFAKQGLKVIYCCNEDSDAAINRRVFSRFCGAPPSVYTQDPGKYELAAENNGYENFMYHPIFPGSPSEIQRMVETYKPDVICIDQLRNLHVPGKQTGLTYILEESAKAVRAIAKKHNLIAVTVTQAGDSATGKIFLDVGDCDSSNTGFAAALDLMLGLGQTEDLQSKGVLGVSVLKTKTAPIQPFYVNVDYSIQRIKS